MSYYRALEMAGVKKALDLTAAELTFVPNDVLAITLLESLTLDDNKMTSLPDQIGNLLRLKALSVRKNMLFTIPDTVSKLVRMERLDLTFNHIVDLPVTSMLNLTNLSELFLGGNQLISPPFELCLTSTLQRISLEGNLNLLSPPPLLANDESAFDKVIDFLRVEAKALTSKRLILQSQGAVAFPKEILRITDLTDVNLSRNLLENIPEEIESLTALCTLTIEDNMLHSLPTALSACTTIFELRLSGNQLYDLPDSFGNFSRLSILDLSNNQFANIPEILQKLVTLTTLLMAGNSIRVIPAWISSLTRLRTLSIAENQVTALPFQLALMSSLQELQFKPEEVDFPPDAILRAGLEAIKNYLLRMKEAAATGIANFSNIPIREFSCHESLASLHITSLILNQNHLRDVYNDVFRLQGIKRLDLSDNDLQSLPTSIRALTSLTDLRVDRNKLGSLDPGIGYCSNLTSLSFVENQVRMLPTSLCWATQLTSLGYQGNCVISPPELYLRKRKIAWILRYLRALHTISESGTLQLMSMKLTEVPEDIYMYKLIKLHLNCNDIRDVHESVQTLSLLQSISLANNKLMRIPPAVCLLRNLQSLIVDDNMITDIPDDIGNLCSLVSLSVAHNDISFLSPAISRLVQLRRLCLDGNQRLSNFPDSLLCLTELTALSMRECSLTMLPPAVTRLLKLKELNLSDNALDALPELESLSLLNIMRLSNNKFMQLPDAVLSLPDLKELSLTGNLIQRLPPTFSQLSGLHILQIDAQFFGDIPREVVGYGGSNVLSYLRNVGIAESTAKLDLAGFGLRSVPTVATRFTILQHLHLHNNPISSIPSAISNLLRLKTLTLNNTKVRSLPVTLPALTALRDLLIDVSEMLFPPAEICAQGVDAIFVYLRKVDMASIAGILDLSGTEMKEFPVDIVYASGITQVDVSNNLITRLPPELSLMSGLTALTLDNNPIRPQLQDVIDRGLPAVMRYLGALYLSNHTRKLDLTEQSLRFFPDEVNPDLMLSLLRLDSNRIQHLPRKLGFLTHLVDLSICCNEISELPETMTALSRLRHLNLDCNQLEIFPEPIIALTGLETLSVSGNRLTLLHPGLQALAQLGELRAEANPLTELPLELGALSKLEVLTYEQETVEIPSRQFRADHAALMQYLHLVHLSRTTGTLDLSGRALETFPVELLRLTSLTALILSRNELTVLPDDMMLRLSMLQLLDVESNRLQALPDSIGFAHGLTALCALGNRIAALPPSLGLVSDYNLLVECEPARLVSPPPEVLARGMRVALGFLRFLYEARGSRVLSLNSWQLRRMPEAIVDIPGLTDLCLRNNELDSLPPAVGVLTCLTRLSVASNRLEALPPELGYMAALTDLDYADNPMAAGFPPADILARGLVQVKQFCRLVAAAKAGGPLEIGRLMPAALNLAGSTLSGLTRLSLDGAQAYEAEGFALFGLDDQLAPLAELSIRGAALHSVPHLVESLTMLRSLDLSDNVLERLPEQMFRSLPQLSELVLAGNRISHLPPHLRLLTALQALRVGDNQLEEVPPPPPPRPSPHNPTRACRLRDMPTLPTPTPRPCRPFACRARPIHCEGRPPCERAAHATEDARRLAGTRHDRGVPDGPDGAERAGQPHNGPAAQPGAVPLRHSLCGPRA